MRTLVASLVLALVPLLGGCASFATDRPRTALACPQSDSAPHDTDGPPVFVFSTNVDECRDGAWDLSRERSPVPVVGVGRLTQKKWVFAPASQERWFGSLVADAQRAAPQKPRVLVYIHGYRNSPADAMERARLIRDKVGFAGPVLALVWPSQRSLLRYPDDEAANEWARVYFTELLRKLVSSRLEIVLVSHSMGNRIAAQALEALRAQGGESASRVPIVVLASPDVDAGMFDRDAPGTFAAPGRTVTVYVSRKDDALATSSFVHGYRRAGDLHCRYAHGQQPVGKPQKCYPQIDGAAAIEVIDTSAVKAGLAGHADFIESAAGSADFCRVINGQPKPGRTEVAGHPGIFVLDPSAAMPPGCPIEKPAAPLPPSQPQP